MKEEIWKDITNYEGLYQVSSESRIRGLKRGKIKNPHLMNTGYPVIHLSKNGKVKLLSVHRLIAQAFIPNPDNKPEVNHKNGIKTDNRIENLEWATSGENQRHAYHNNLKKCTTKKFTLNDVVNMRKMRIDGLGYQAIGDKFMTTPAHVWRIINKEIYKTT